jgi:hypothetical protein
VRNLSANSKNSKGIGEKGAKTHSSQGRIKNIRIPFLFNFSRYTFSLYDYVHLSNV